MSGFLSKVIYNDKKFYKTVLVLTFPIVLQSFITLGVNLIDTVMIGKLGETALSATSLATQFVSIFQTLCMGLSMGASVLVARFWGMRDIPSMRKTITIMVRFGLIIATIFTILTIAMPETIMWIFTDEEPIVKEGVRYLKYAAFSYYFHALSLNCTIMLRCIRKVHLPLIASISSFFFNIFGNYVLIFGHLGFKPMGIAGASIATLITRIIEFGVIVGYFMFIDKDVGYRVKHIFMSTKGLMKQYVSISIPVLISDGLLALGSSAVTMIIGHMGESFIAANAVISVVTRLTNIFAGAISQSSAVIVGNTIGEGRIDDVRRQSDAFFALGFALGILASILVLLSYPVIIKVYDLTEETAALLKILLMAVAIMVVFDAANSIMTKGVLRAGGDTKALMVGDCIFLLLVSVPLGYLAGLVWHLPSFWVYFFLKIEAILKCIWAFFRNRSGKWIKNVSTENTAP